jgi:hypothetical protein
MGSVTWPVSVGSTVGVSDRGDEERFRAASAPGAARRERALADQHSVHEATHLRAADLHDRAAKLHEQVAKIADDFDD